jgi:glycerol-3-phosphate acyltransferase PlsX
VTRVVLDAMGGDLAPAATVEGAVAAARAGLEVTIVGDKQHLRAELARLDGATPALEVVHAPEAVEMGEHAARSAVRRRDTSIAVGLQLLKDGAGDAFISAGNTGAVLAVALVRLGRLPEVERPAIGVVIPTPCGEFLMLDAGANAESRPSHLLQWAHLGASYLRATRGLAEPRVGLLNIGAEETKGSQLTVEAHAALAASGLRFVGNVEGRDLTNCHADVVVTDGFTGNVALKLAEGVIEMMFDELRAAAERSLRARLGGLLLRPAAREIRDRLDYRRYGAAPLLGVDGTVFIAHGSSDAPAIENAIRSAAEAAEAGVVEALREAAVAGRPAEGLASTS